MNAPMPFDELTTEAVAEWFEAAFMDPHIDRDGDIRLRMPTHTMYVTHDPDRGGLRLHAGFALGGEVDVDSLIVAANDVNARFALVSCAIIGPGTGTNEHWECPHAVMSHYMVLRDSLVTPRNVVLTTQRFASICDTAMREHIAPTAMGFGRAA